MAWDTYSGRHRIRVRPTRDNCANVLVRRGGHDVTIGSVCRIPGGYDYSYVGTRARLGPVKSAREAVKKTVSGYRSWIGSDTEMRGSRRRRKKRRRQLPDSFLTWRGRPDSTAR
jgi:hypothetical protein